MKNKMTRIVALMLVCCMLCLCACSNISAPMAGNENQLQDSIVSVDKQDYVSQLGNTGSVAPKGEYKEGVVLVKYDGAFSDKVLSQLDFVSAEPLYNGSSWYSVKLGKSMDTVEAVKYLTELGCFDAVDYDYIMKTEGEVVDVSGNPDHDKEKHHGTHKIPEGWEYMAENDINPGGSSDVVIAVIDTGVDYNHLDLRNNIWVNPAEIPDNGMDDDGNGYVDDVYGWDCVGDDKDPMDDNGHGTHVAGIIAAENNEIGGVGIAYNCKIMVLKAGNSSGYFNNSDIAEAIQYAYMNGASVINMSFGGSSISIAVEEALENAYNSCVLVAAAGNDGLCNNLSCTTCDAVGVSYPAALPYVIGVMSTTADGSKVSSFSNYDHKPNNSVEYEVYAVGESVHSCWPGNKYAALNGTSMAAPTVSAIAALLRSAYPDRNVYSTKYLQSQIVNTGTINPYNFLLEDFDGAHSVANVYEALTRIPTPDVNLYDYYIDDSTSISEANNGNGVMDAGETVHLFVSLMNRGGVASNVNVSIDTLRSEGLTDPYFTFTNPSITLSDIGTYSVREAGEDQYFEILIDADCPNDYMVDFNIHFTYTNGLDTDDETVYSGDGTAQFVVSSGYHLPDFINEDTVFTADRLYIVGQDVIIPAGVTVTFEEGCQIQFHDDRAYYNSPAFIVYGTLNMEGSAEQPITLVPSEQYINFLCLIKVYGTLDMEYVDAYNLNVRNYNDGSPVSHLTHCRLFANSTQLFVQEEGGVQGSYMADNFWADSLDHCYLENIDYGRSIHASQITNCIIRSQANGNNNLSCDAAFSSTNAIFENNILFTEYKRNDYSSSELAFAGSVKNNLFISETEDIASLRSLIFRDQTRVENNSFNAAYQKYGSQLIHNYYGTAGTPIVDIYGSCSDLSALWPHVVSVEMFNADGESITTIGKEEIKVRITFNRPMDTTQDTFATFGTVEPYADYKIEGEYVSDTVWEGTYTLKAQIENGLNYLKVNNACAAEDPTKTVFGKYQLHEFTIDTTAAMSMTLQAVATDGGIQLTWAQDDYDTLLGYNIYRSEEKDGNFVKLNPTILLSTDESFLDDNAEPGKTYWYTYTVVLSDFTESAPAGKVFCTAMDTIAPNIYHTPVNQGYANNNLVISCTASDNISIASVTLYYRTVGETEWKSIAMSKQSDKYSATVFGSELTLDGLEYYIVAVDNGGNTVSKGSAEAPYSVVIKDASAVSRLGDVDGDGTVTTKDALMIMKVLSGDLILTDDAFKRADLNGDGMLSSVEALRILQYINGKVTNLEM